MMSSTKKQKSKIKLLSCAAVLALAPAMSAYAQSAESVVAFDMPEQSLNDALKSYGLTTERQVMFTKDIVAGKTANALSGNLAPGAALDQLLDGTGLVYETTSSNVILIKAPQRQAALQTDEASNDSIEVANVQNSAASGPSGDGEPVAVTGQVKAFGSDANLKGAQVEIVETGQRTATDDLGRFRFSSVAPGEYTLRISYLGRDPIVDTITVGRDGFSETYSMGSENTLDVITVYGSRSARAQSLNQERTAENSTTVLASDFLGQFDGTTISETLRRAPGVAFEQSPVTGDGTNVIVRGLAPDFNQVTLNGLRLPEGTGVGRSPDLSNLLTESISKVTISKTLLPSQDSSGAGGLIEIETKTPLDRPRRFASFSAQTSGRSGGLGDEQQYSGTLSGRFGADESFGLSASVQYVDSSIDRSAFAATQQLGPYLPLSGDGFPITSEFFVNPTLAFPFEAGVDALYPSFATTNLSGAESTNFSGSVSAAWEVDDHTTLFVDYSRAEQEVESFDRAVDTFAFTSYALLPIDSLGGEVRGALVTEDAFADFGFPGVLAGVSQRYSFAETDNTTDTFSLRGETQIDKWTFDYTGGYSSAESNTPVVGAVNLVGSAPFGVPLDLDLLSSQARENTVNGRIVSIFAPADGSNRFVLPLFSQSGFDFFNSEGGYNLQSIFLDQNQTGKNERASLNVSARYDFDASNLKYVEVGAFYENSEFRNTGVNGVTETFPLSPVSVSDLGVAFGNDDLSELGIDGGFAVVSIADIRNLANNQTDLAAGNANLSVNERSVALSDLAAQEFTEEESVSVYAQARIDIGKLEVVGGLRLDKVDVNAKTISRASLFDVNLIEDLAFRDRNTVLVDRQGSQTTLLPRVAATYRANENLLFRAGYSESIARPQIQNLSEDQTISLFLSPFASNTGAPALLSVAAGNPELEPSRTKSFDLSGEYYFSDAGQIEISLFYKSIDNILEQNVTRTFDDLSGIVLPNEPAFETLPAGIEISVSTPVNSDSEATVWGIEAAFEKQLTFLPGFWDGFGVLANYTYTDSEKVELFSFFNPDTFLNDTVELEGVRFAGDPTHSGTAAITYNKHNIDAALSFTKQGKRLVGVESFRFEVFDEEDESLDFRAEYRLDQFAGDWRIFFQGSDLLKDSSDSDVETFRSSLDGSVKAFTGANYFGGRELALGISASF